MDISWEDFKAEVISQLEIDHTYVFRGQRDSEWALSTTMHRTGQLRTHNDFLIYI